MTENSSDNGESYMQELAGRKDPAEKIMNRQGPSLMAERVAIIRAFESRKPEGERVCYDPYAARFINPKVLEFVSSHPEKLDAGREEVEHRFLGLHNSILARVRYFDDFVVKSLADGIEQLVILGAGYDTRTYRIRGLDKIMVFEVDHPGTQRVKVERVKEIFGSLPGHVAYVPVDLETDDLGRRLAEHGYGPSKKTLFLAEGLVAYLPPKAVDDLLSFIVNNSGKGSLVIFDYTLRPDAESESDRDVSMRLQEYAKKAGEPPKFSIREGTVETFLASRGYSGVHNITAEEYKEMYFPKDAAVLKRLCFVHAVVG